LLPSCNSNPLAASNPACLPTTPAVPNPTPQVFSMCSAGPPPQGHRDLLAALSSKFPSECSGFAADQDYTFLEAARVDRSRTVAATVLRHPVERVVGAGCLVLGAGCWVGLEWVEWAGAGRGEE